MTFMLDTSICVYAIKQKPAFVLQHLRENLDKGVCISAITYAELAYGVEKSAFPEKNRIALLQFLSILDILPFDDRAGAEYGKICAYCQRHSAPTGTTDLLIAAHAKAEGLTLVTNHIHELRCVTGLNVVDWAY